MQGLEKEISFQTSRSGGKGGQNVNKVETAVIASLDIEASTVLDDRQKSLIREKLSNRINSADILQVKAQSHRTQLANKSAAIERILELVELALHRKKARIATKASKASREKRLQSKKQRAEIKAGRNWRNHA